MYEVILQIKNILYNIWYNESRGLYIYTYFE